MNESTGKIKSQIDKLLKQIQPLSLSDPLKAKELAEEAIKLAHENGFQHREGAALTWHAHIIMGMAGDEDVLKAARTAVELLKDAPDKLLIARAFTVLGNGLKLQCDSFEALEYYQHAIDVYKELDDIAGVSTILNNIASTYRSIGLFDEAYSAFSEAIDVLEGSDYLISKAAAVGNLASLLVEQDDPQKAESLMEQALELHRKAGTKQGEGICLRDMGKLKASLGDKTEAERYYRQALAVLSETSSNQFMGYTLFLLSNLKEEQGQFNEAEEYLVQAVEIAKQFKSQRRIADAEFDLAALRVRMGVTEDVEPAMHEFLKYLRDSGDDLEYKIDVYTSLSQLYELKEEFSTALDYYKQKCCVEKQYEALQRENDVVRVRLRAEYKRSENEKKLLEAQQKELQEANDRLQEAAERIKKLSGLLPICAYCKSIRDDSGYWNEIEAYIASHSDTEFTHGICPECAKKHFPDYNLFSE